jgi:RND family efflux transporter MFP subunit
MKRRRVLIGTIITIVLALILFRVFVLKTPVSENPAMGRGAGPRGPIAVKTAEVVYGPIMHQSEFTGTVKASSTYVVAAKVSGRLVHVSKRIGDRVRRGELIGRIDDTEYRQALDEADALAQVSRASVADAKAQMDHSKRELQRIMDLVEKGISSQAELDAVQTNQQSQLSRLELARAQLAQREAARAQAKTRMEYTALRAAQPGYVAIRHTDGGTLLSVNSPVLTIVGIDTVYVEFAVSERDYPRIIIGQNAKIRVESLPGKDFTGTITHRAPMFQTATRTAMVEVAIVNDSLLLKPGMFARIAVLLAKKESAQIVPSASIVNRDGAGVVFMVDSSNTARMIQVAPGIIDGERAEIESPVLRGRIVTIGQHLLTDGAAVTGEKEGTRTGTGNGEAKTGMSGDTKQAKGKKR